MQITQERQLVLQAVLDGQLDVAHATTEELIYLHHEMADQMIEEAMWAAEERRNVLVFALDWEYQNPN